MLDLVIRNARILDGSGGPERSGDLAIDGGRIASVDTPVAPGTAEREMDAGGLAVMPGIVDLHTHSDVSVLSDPGCVSAVVQGVTTIAIGLCGFSAAPVTADSIHSMIDEEPVFAFPGVSWDWTTVGGHLEAVARARPAVNVTTLLGHNTLRRTVMGGANRPPSAGELARMQDLLREGLAEGARGFSTGLSYAPGLFADMDELVALASVAAEAGRPYHTHMRYGDLGVRASLAEAIETATRAGVELNVSHLYPRPWDPPDEPERFLEMIATARASGVTVTFDMTVFPRGGGAWVQVLPKWARDGGHASTVEIIRDPVQRARLAAEILAQPDFSADWDDQLIVKVNRPDTSRYVGRSIGDIARERGQEPVQVALDLVLEDGQFWVAPTIKNQDHLDRLMRDPLCVPVTDGMVSHPVTHRDLGIMPKTFGSFPQVLGRYVREAGVLPLAEAVRRMTTEPADRLGLGDRGRLAAGAAADLLIFDPATIANRATEAGDPAAFPAGIRAVMVNGRWALEDGNLTLERAGRTL